MFIPRVPEFHTRKFSMLSINARQLYEAIEEQMYAERPSSLGFPIDITQSSYYPEDIRISREEINEVSRAMEKEAISPENTRIYGQNKWPDCR